MAFQFCSHARVTIHDQYFVQQFINHMYSMHKVLENFFHSYFRNRNDARWKIFRSGNFTRMINLILMPHTTFTECRPCSRTLTYRRMGMSTMTYHGIMLSKCLTLFSDSEDSKSLICITFSSFRSKKLSLHYYVYINLYFRFRLQKRIWSTK